MEVSVGQVDDADPAHRQAREVAALSLLLGPAQDGIRTQAVVVEDEVSVVDAVETHLGPHVADGQARVDLVGLRVSERDQEGGEAVVNFIDVILEEKARSLLLLCRETEHKFHHFHGVLSLSFKL